MNGILPIWKERGMTSFDCVFQLRKLLKIKKIGHSGTLDPEVDGVLPICIGKATKVIEYLQDSSKTYIGEITLGIATETEDAYGAVIERKAVTEFFTTVEIDEMMQSMVGEIIQVPPMYSAVKVNGKRLYEYARNHQVVDRPERRIHIYSFERCSEPVYHAKNQTLSWKFKVTCSKGTYVRTLAVDLGRKWDYPAHMSDLTRLASGGFMPNDCFTLTQVKELMEKGTIETVLQPITNAFRTFPTLEISTEMYQRVKNGAVLEETELESTAFPVVLTYQQMIVALYDKHPEKIGKVKPKKML